jgi:hypothetical protein
MVAFGSGMSAAPAARVAAREAALKAKGAFGDGVTPALAIVFASLGYTDVAEVAAAVREAVGDVPIVGGSSGACVFADEACAARGVSVVLLGGDVLVDVRVARLRSPDLVDVVPAAEAVAKAADAASRKGFGHYTCLAFAPSVVVDGEALVAAVRKGAGARAQLAGGLTGDDLTMDRAKVYVGGKLRADSVVVAGIFSKTPIGIAARHGYRAVGPVRTITRTEGVWLAELDGKPAVDVWLEDARAAGATPPSDRKDIALYLANYYQLGLLEGPPTPRPGRPAAMLDDPRELVARAPFAVREDGAMLLSASIAEGTQVRVLHATRDDLLRASGEAVASAVARAGGTITGALLLACSGRLAALGDSFPEEVIRIHRKLEAPIGGACVFGEIARNVRDADAFFNTTAVVVAFTD